MKEIGRENGREITNWHTKMPCTALLRNKFKQLYQKNGLLMKEAISVMSVFISLT
jgi:hypothetical protein